MTSINKVQIPQNSGFDLQRAMELANLLVVAYDEYEVRDYQEANLQANERKLPPNDFLCSPEFVDLSKTPAFCSETLTSEELSNSSLMEQLANVFRKPQKPQELKSRVYGELDSFWQKTQNTKQYKRIDNFWVTAWWWLNAFDFPFLAKLLKGNIGELFTDIHENRKQGLLGLVQSAANFGRDTIDNVADSIIDDNLFGFVAQSQDNPKEIFVVFRGTRESPEWLNNLKPVPQKFLEKDLNKFGDLGEVRNGFNRIYSERRQGGNQKTIAETITELFETRNDLLTNDAQIFITGHSLGAALATLAAVHIQKIAEKKGINPTLHLYTFANPRVGDAVFAAQFNNFPYNYRIINSEDLIQSIPLPTTKVVDDEMFKAMNPGRKARILWVRGFLETITVGQSAKCYEHIGIPVTFTKQTGAIAGNHNLTLTYREALNVDL